MSSEKLPREREMRERRKRKREGEVGIGYPVSCGVSNDNITDKLRDRARPSSRCVVSDDRSFSSFHSGGEIRYRMLYYWGLFGIGMMIFFFDGRVAGCGPSTVSFINALSND